MGRYEELRVFYTQADMIAGMEAFRSYVGDVKIKFKDQTVEADGRRIAFRVSNEQKDVRQSIAGLCFNRVWMDGRIDSSEICYAMARMSSPYYKVDNHVKVFFREVRDL